MKIKIKFFILGFLSCLILSGIIIGGIFIVNDLNKNNNNNDNNNNKEKEGTVVEGYRYIEEKRSDDNENNITCTMLNNVKQYANSYDDSYFITNDNDLYIINKYQKFSDTNENCHKYTNKKIKNIIINSGDGITFIDENNNSYYASHEKKDLEAYTGSPQFVNTDILWYMDTGTEETENHNFIYKIIVLEPDGKLYNYKTKWQNDGYILLSRELEYEIDNEKIVNVQMEHDPNFNTWFIKNLYTDKGVYYSVNTNPECIEYADIKCEYKLEKENYFSTKINEVIYYYGLYNSKDEDGEYITRFEYLNKDGKRVLIRKEKNSE